jgi:hypothetical protein
MAITDNNGNKMTPKQKASHLRRYVVKAIVWDEIDPHFDEYSEREKELVEIQLAKYRNRIVNLLGYDN